jgi:hypothetical protein
LVLLFVFPIARLAFGDRFEGRCNTAAARFVVT